MMPSQTSSPASSDDLFCSSSDSETDSISLTSTALSEQQEEYGFESILRQRASESGWTEYLVRWEGYPDERCTWEPPSSFDPETLQDFREKCLAGISPLTGPDIDVVEKKMDAYGVYMKGRADRTKRRAAKRARLSSKSTRSHRHPKSRKQDVEARRLPSSHRNAIDEQASLDKSKHALKTVNSRTVDDDPRPPKLFKYLSTKRKHELAGRVEPPADPTKLDFTPLGQLGQKSAQPRKLWVRSNLVEGPSDSLPPSAEKQQPKTTNVEKVVTTKTGQSSPSRLTSDTCESVGEGGLLMDKALPARVIYQVNESLDYQPQPDEEAELKRTNSKRTMSGRFWSFGEALITLKFGHKHIGDARIQYNNLGHRSWIQSLVSLKKHDSIVISFEEMCTVEDYSQLCLARQNIKYENTWLCGFADTYSALNEVTQYLRDSGAAALWHHPSDDVVLVLYASKSAPWDFFDLGWQFPSNSTLRMVVRNSLPQLQTLQPSNTAIQSQVISKSIPKGNVHSSAREPTFVVRTGAGQFVKSTLHITPTAMPVMVQSKSAVKSTDDIDDQTSMALQDTFPGHLAGAYGDSSSQVVAEDDIASQFERMFGITYSQLLGYPKVEPKNQAFFLMFPENRELDSEFSLVKQFLNKHNKAAIYSNRERSEPTTGEWEHWKRFIIGFQDCAILFHSSFLCYHELPDFKTVLKGTVARLFRLSLTTPLSPDQPPTYIERIFPHGGAVLLTDSTIINETNLALTIIESFCAMIKLKKKGTWKLFLRPNVMAWLLEVADKAEDQRFLQMYHCLMKVDQSYLSTTLKDITADTNIIVSPNYISRYSGALLDRKLVRELSNDVSATEGRMPHDSPTGEAKSAPSKEDVRDEDYLVEYFAGWSLQNIGNHRRFFAVSPVTCLKKWNKWAHIEVWSPKAFMEMFFKSNNAK